MPVPASPPGSQVSFQFLGTQSASSHADTATPHGNGANGPANRVGSWIERVNNLRDRSDVPQSKRRKLDGNEPSQEAKNLPVRSGSGILGAYVKERRNEDVAVAAMPNTTVDLTDGGWNFSVPSCLPSAPRL